MQELELFIWRLFSWVWDFEANAKLCGLTAATQHVLYHQFHHMFHHVSPIRLFNDTCGPSPFRHWFQAGGVFDHQKRWQVDHLGTDDPHKPHRGGCHPCRVSSQVTGKVGFLGAPSDSDGSRSQQQMQLAAAFWCPEKLQKLLVYRDTERCECICMILQVHTHICTVLLCHMSHMYTYRRFLSQSIYSLTFLFIYLFVACGIMSMYMHIVGDTPGAICAPGCKATKPAGAEWSLATRLPWTSASNT